MENINSVKDFREKLIEGLELSFKKLVQQKIKEDAELIFSKNDGEIVRIKAKDL